MSNNDNCFARRRSLIQKKKTQKEKNKIWNIARKCLQKF